MNPNVAALNARSIRALIKTSSNRSSYLDRYMKWTDHGRRYALDRADVADVTRYARNIASLLAGLDRDALLNHAAFYSVAHAIAREHARRYRVTLRTASCVIAAVSPNMAWQANIKAARAVHETHANRKPYDTPQALARKASQGLGAPAGYAPYVQAFNVLKHGPQALTGPKRVPFADNITTAGRSLAVTVDGHAYVLAALALNAGRHGISAAKVTDKERDKVATAHAAVAALLNLWPAQVQAAAWTLHRAKDIARP